MGPDWGRGGRAAACGGGGALGAEPGPVTDRSRGVETRPRRRGPLAAPEEEETGGGSGPCAAGEAPGRAEQGGGRRELAGGEAEAPGRGSSTGSSQELFLPSSLLERERERGLRERVGGDCRRR